MGKKVCFVVLCLLFPLSLLTAQDLTSLIYLTEDYPPENYVESGEVRGLAVDLLKEVWKKLQVPAQPIRVLPWARAYETALRERSILLFSTTRTASRENLFHWAGPIRTTTFHLFAHRGSPIRLKSLEEAKKFRIGVLINDVGEVLLSEAGFERKNLTRVTQMDQLLGMMQLGRIDLFVSAHAAVIHAMNQNPGRKFPFRTVLPLSSESVWYAFSKDVPQSLVREFQATLNLLEPVRKKLLSDYQAWE